MVTQAEAEKVDVLTPFFKDFFKPQFLSSFRENFPAIRIVLFTNPEEQPQSFTLEPYPFMTIYDLKVMIYQKLGKQLWAHPHFQSLMAPYPLEEAEPEVLADEYAPLDFIWTKMENQQRELITLPNPFQQAASNRPNRDFVTDTGKKNTSFEDRYRICLEDIIPKIYESSPPLFHLFLYKDVLPLMNVELRASEREWAGRIEPYYPELTMQQDPNTLTSARLEQIKIQEKYVAMTLQFTNHLEDLIKNKRVALLDITLIGVKFARFVWSRPEERSPELENLFYELPATHERPFIRMLPGGATAVSKLRMQSMIKIPDISDPRLLLQWAAEENPFPTKDFVFMKTMIRRTIGTQPALYGTLRLYHDRSADYIILPPKQLRFLDPRVDLGSLGTLMTQTFEGIPIEGRTPDIGEATIICGIRPPSKSKTMTYAAIKKRLQAFAPFFQEISPLAGEQPLIMLRYKAVSNFLTEDRVFSYLTQLASRRSQRGETPLSEFIVAVEKEFQLTRDEAKEITTQWFNNHGAVAMAEPEQKNYILVSNPGTDIAIFAQQSFYTLHIYRITSVSILRRLATIFSLLLSSTEEDLKVPTAAVQEYENLSNAVSVQASSNVLLNSRLVEGEEEEQTGEQRDGIVEGPAAASSIKSEESELEEDDEEEAKGGIWSQFMMGGPQQNGPVSEADFLNLGGEEEGDEEEGDEVEENVEASIARASREEQQQVAASLQQAATQRVTREINYNQESDEEQQVEEENENAVGKKKKRSYAKYVIRKLQEADQRLFLYPTEAGGRKVKKYVTACQATESRQPYVMNQEQFDAMRELYENDPVYFMVYGEKNDPPPTEGDEVYTVLKYGTNPSRPNYYLCCPYFCTKDYIMIREVEFKEVGRVRGKQKVKDSCPFCGGLEIRNLKKPAPNETVIRRRVSTKDNKQHLYVGFLTGETNHPEGFYLPCCFKEDYPLQPSDRRFKHLQEIAEESKEEEEEVEETTTAGVPAISYQITIERAYKKYIVGPEKFPLKISSVDGPQIGLLPEVLDKYFAQNPQSFVSREYNKMELLPNAQAFLRVGVENRSPFLNDSFFSAVAPYLQFKNNAQAVKARILEVVRPRIFSFLNYGNMVLEYYDAGDPTPPDNLLRSWAQSELQIDMKPTNKEALVRLWKSYHRFEGIMSSRDLSKQETFKQYRTFAQLFALPGLITPRGVVFVVLDINEKNELSVRCPPFGFNVEQYSRSDIGFILHHYSGVWEPIFYSDNRLIPGMEPTHKSDLTFQRALEAAWPKIVRQRVQEFETQCQGLGRGLYTSSSFIDPMAMISVSRAIQTLAEGPTGIVRDAYNHIAALTFRPGRGSKGLVALPVVDDELIAPAKFIYLDWDDFEPAPMEVIVAYYQENFDRVFSMYPGYRISRRVKSNATNEYVALRLKNGLYIPSGPPRSEEGISNLKIEYVDEMEWRYNRDIVFDKGESIKDILMAEENEMEEIFQHLRLTFSNWFSGSSVETSSRQQIKDIIDNIKLPLFEKRKRLEILLGNTILSWMDTDVPTTGEKTSIVRVDCTLKTTQPTCSGRCAWRQSGPEGIGRCYLHSPKDFRLGGRRVNGPRLLMYRLLEELLRFPDRKRELVEKGVSTLVDLKDAVLIGDQYILPESSVAWYDLLRLDWIREAKEKKMYYEEMSRQEKEAIEQAVEEQGEEEALEEQEAPSSIQSTESEAETISENLTDILKDLFGANDPKTKNLYLLEAKGEPETPLLVYLQQLGTSPLELDLEEDVSTLTKEAIKKLAMFAEQPIIQINTIKDPPEVIAYAPAKKQRTPVPFILIITEDGPRLLSSSPSSPSYVQLKAMPKGLLNIYMKQMKGVKKV